MVPFSAADNATHDSPAREGSARLVIAVHGIRTFGEWQDRLRALLAASDQRIEFIQYQYGYLSAVAFMIPFLRWIATRRFERWLVAELSIHKATRVDVVAHSFGTHLVAWTLMRRRDLGLKGIHTFILAGSVLKPGFPWQNLLGSVVRRVVNDCGTRDGVLLLSQLFVLFTGMAGRIGFHGMQSDRFLNRYFSFGHSGYFEHSGVPTNDFMARYWLPLLLAETPAERVDQRLRGGLLDGVFLTVLNNAEPIKLTVYVAPFVGLAIGFYLLYREADRQAKIAHSTLTFLTDDILRAAGPAKARGRELTVREVLDSALAAAPTRPAESTEARVELLRTIGLTYRDLGLYDKATTALETARHLSVEQLGEKNKFTVAVDNELALVLIRTGQLKRAETLLESALDRSRIIYGRNSEEAMTHENNLAIVLVKAGKFSQAVELLEHSLRVFRSKHQEGSSDALTAIHNLAYAYLDLDRVAEAKALAEDTYRARRDSVGEEHPDTLNSQVLLANVMLRVGDEVAARREVSDALRKMSKVFGAEHPNTLECKLHMVGMLGREGQLVEATQLAEEVERCAAQKLGENHEITLNARNSLGFLAHQQGDFQKAVRIDRDVLDRRLRAFGDHDFGTLGAQNNLAGDLMRLELFDEAESLFRRAFEITKEMLGADHTATADALFNLAGVHFEMSRFQSAQLEIVEVLRVRRNLLGADHAGTISACRLAGDVSLRLNRFEEAESLLLEADRGTRKLGQPNPKNLQAIDESLVDLYQRWGRELEERRWRDALSLLNDPVP